MSVLTRLALAITALASLLAAATATAGAVTWHNTGSTQFTATGGPGTLSVGANNLSCLGSTGSGAVASGSTSTNAVGNGTTVSSPCTLVGQSVFVHCVYTMTGSAFASGVTTGSTSVTCHAKLTASPIVTLCVISGSTPGNYTNPIGTITGRFTQLASSSLVVSNGTASCPLGTGNGTITERTGVVTGGTPTARGPILDRTP